MKRPLALLCASAAGAVLLTGCADGGTHADTAHSTATATGSASASGSAPASAQPKLVVSGAYVRQPPTADMAAGYLTLTNTGREADRLLGVSSDFASHVTMHRTTASDAMAPVSSFAIPAGGRLVLSLGGNHLMLMGMKRKPVVGDTITFHLRFAHAAPITVRAPVQPTTYQPRN